MIIILGDFDKINSKLIIVILSKKKYFGSEIFVNKKKINSIDIIKNTTTKIILDVKQFNIENITIEIYNKSKIISSIKNLNLIKVFEKVIIVGCDSTLGLEKNLWKKIKNIKSHYLIHCGDQIYNDKIFKKYYRFVNIEDKKNIKKLEKEIFNNYYNQFYRCKNILKNNLNLMIPDDHEIVDDAYENKHKNNEKFKIIKNIFQKFVKNIELSLKINSDDLYYLENEKNKSIYILNFQTEFNDELLNKYDFDNKIIPYNNIIILSRKSLLSSKNNLLNQLIFSQESITLVNIDNLLKKIINSDSNKKMYVFCGDDHSYKKSIISYKNKNICEIITCGSINTVPELFKNKIILNTQIDGITLENISYKLINSFVKIKNQKNTIEIINVFEKKNILFYLLDNIINVYNLL